MPRVVYFRQLCKVPRQTCSHWMLYQCRVQGCLNQFSSFRPLFGVVSFGCSLALFAFAMLRARRLTATF